MSLTKDTSDKCELLICSRRILETVNVGYHLWGKKTLIIKYNPRALSADNEECKNTLSSKKHRYVFFADESLSKKVQLRNEGVAYYLLCFHFRCSSCATDKPRPESHLFFYPHFPPSCCLALIQDNWAVQHIVLKCCLVSWQINASQHGEGHLFSFLFFEKDWRLEGGYLQMNVRERRHADFISNSSVQQWGVCFYYTKLCHFLSIYIYFKDMFWGTFCLLMEKWEANRKQGERERGYDMQ